MPTTFDLNAFSGPFRSESDRACAVLGAALVDERLKHLFDRRLHFDNTELLSHHGVFGSFSARIKVARALDWIDDDVHSDLKQVRDIRNKFAHHADHLLSFADDSVVGKCKNLRVPQILIDAHAEAAKRSTRFSGNVIMAMASAFDAPRQRFEITIEMLAQHLDELAGTAPGYLGPSLRDELRSLGLACEPTLLIRASSGPAPA
jgi:hypothetical protein